MNVNNKGACLSDCIKIKNKNTATDDFFPDISPKCDCAELDGNKCCKAGKMYLPDMGICINMVKVIDYCVSYNTDGSCSKCYSPYDFLVPANAKCQNLLCKSE